MGTRGLRVWQYRKRYYSEFYAGSTYPGGLGVQIVRSIPTTYADYLVWLEAERKYAEGLEARWTTFLSINIYQQKPKRWSSESEQCSLPTWLPPLNDLFIEWIWILDLDNELLIVNNSAYFKLGQMPSGWIELLEEECRQSDELVLGEGVVELATPSATNRNLTLSLGDNQVESTNSSTYRQVTPKNLYHFHWRRRHGPVLRSLVFESWLRTLSGALGSALPQWSPQDLPFREIAFAALCLALGGEHTTLVPDSFLRTYDDVFALIDGDFSEDGGFREADVSKAKEKGSISDSEGRPLDNGEFARFLTTGAHVLGDRPASATEETTYWMQGVLVFLTNQLGQPGALQRELLRAEAYCQKHHAKITVDAVLLSIEYVVLFHILPGTEIQHSPVMPFFSLHCHHIAIDQNLGQDRRPITGGFYSHHQGADEDPGVVEEAPYEGTTASESQYSMSITSPEEEERPVAEDLRQPPSQSATQGSPKATFFALVHIFEAAARRNTPLTVSATRVGCFTNEIYSAILSQIADRQTLSSFLQVLPFFRQQSQEHLLFTDGKTLQPYKAERMVSSNTFLEYDFSTGTTRNVEYKAIGEARGGIWRDMERHQYAGELWNVLVGTGHNHKCLLPDVEFRLAASS